MAMVVMVNTSIISMSNYTFIAFDLEEHMSCTAQGSLLLFTCKPCCLQTCNYDQSLLITDTNTPTKFL